MSAPPAERGVQMRRTQADFDVRAPEDEATYNICPEQELKRADSGPMHEEAS